MSLEKVNILLVDDQPAKLLTYETILGGLGENLVKASSGDEALQHLLKTDFAVVLVDVCMPTLDGFELASLMRQHPRCERTAIIFISAIQITNVDQLKGYESGAVDYISVPVVPELLRARVAIFCDLYRKTAALERMNRELEQRVVERTAELERDLAERKRLEDALREADRRKDEFLAMLAHELRNPLAPIRNAVSILRVMKLRDPLVREERDVIDRQTALLSRLVDDLLDVSRITRGQITLRKQALDLKDIVARAVESSQPVIDQRDHRLDVALPEEPVPVDGDVTRLVQVITNLLNNAAKYTPDGGLIWLTLERQNHWAVLRVRDTGAGIRTELLPRIFDLFTKGEGSLAHSEGGLGIGLTLVKRLVEMHGGSVDAFSDGPGRGSEFVVRLPLRVGASERAHETSPAEDWPRSARGYRVLVIDDNRDSANSMGILLQMCGHRVRACHDGPSGLAEAAEFQPQLVLLDIGLPDMNGYEVAKRLRALPGLAQVTIAAMTGYGRDDDRRRARAAGFDHHLVKPVDPEALERVVASLAPPTVSVAPAAPPAGAVAR